MITFIFFKKKGAVGNNIIKRKMVSVGTGISHPTQFGGGTQCTRPNYNIQ